MATLTFRPATMDDALFIARGFHTAVMMNDTPEERIRCFAETICTRDDVLYCPHNTTIACLDGTPVGMVTAYNGAEYKAMRAVTFDLLREKMGIDLQNMEDEAQPGEYYIDSLAVLPQYRGQGIGTALLKHSIAEAQHYPEITITTLAVDPDNPKARHLYETLGFRYASDLFIFGHTYHKMALPLRISH